MIVADTNKNPNSIAEANLAIASETRSNTQYLTPKNKKLEQDLQAAQQEIEQLHVAVENTIYAQFYLDEMRETILGEVLTLG